MTWNELKTYLLETDLEDLDIPAAMDDFETILADKDQEKADALEAQRKQFEEILLKELYDTHDPSQGCECNRCRIVRGVLYRLGETAEEVYEN